MTIDTGIIKKYFGETRPRNIVTISELPTVKGKEGLTSGAKLVNGLEAHWQNENAKLLKVKDSRSDQISLKANEAFGEFFSVSLAFGESIIGHADQQNFLSIVYGDVLTNASIDETVYSRARLSLQKGKKLTTSDAPVLPYNYKKMASFEMNDEMQAWNSANRGWIDLIFFGAKFSEINISDVVLLVQKKAEI